MLIPSSRLFLLQIRRIWMRRVDSVGIVHQITLDCVVMYRQVRSPLVHLLALLIHSHTHTSTYTHCTRTRRTRTHTRTAAHNRIHSLTKLACAISHAHIYTRELRVRRYTSIRSQTHSFAHRHTHTQHNTLHVLTYIQSTCQSKTFSTIYLKTADQICGV